MSGITPMPGMLPNGANQISVGDILAAQATFNTNGTCARTGSGNKGPDNWFNPTTANIGNSYFIRIHKTSGLTVTGITEDLWTGLNAQINLTCTGGAGSWTGTWEISTNSSGNPVIGGGAITVSNAL